MAKATLAGCIIQEDEVETGPDQISTSCIVEEVVKLINEDPAWHCGRCTLQIEDKTQPSIITHDV